MARNILFFTDFHLNYKMFNAITAAGVPERADEIYSTFNWVEKMCRKYNVQRAVFGGDLFQSVSDLKLPFVKLALDGFNLIKVPVDILDGNHDGCDKNFYATSLFKYVVDKVIHEPYTTFMPDLGIRLTYFPFCRNLEEAKQNIEKFLNYEEPTVVFMHQGVEGKCYDDLAIPVALFNRPNIKKVFCGHYHFPVEDGKIIYPGSVFSCNFIDDTARKILIYDVDSDTFVYEENPACSYFISLTQKQIKENIDRLSEIAKSTYLKIEKQSQQEEIELEYSFLEQFKGYSISDNDTKKEFTPQYTYVDSEFTVETSTSQVDLAELDFSFDTYKNLVLNTKENKQYLTEHKINNEVLEEILKTTYELGC